MRPPSCARVMSAAILCLTGFPSCVSIPESVCDTVLYSTCVISHNFRLLSHRSYVVVTWQEQRTQRHRGPTRDTGRSPQWVSRVSLPTECLALCCATAVNSHSPLHFWILPPLNAESATVPVGSQTSTQKQAPTTDQVSRFRHRCHGTATCEFEAAIAVFHDAQARVQNRDNGRG